MRNYSAGTPVIRRLADGMEECLTVESVTEGQIAFRQQDGSLVVRAANTNLEMRYALCGYRVVPPAPKMLFDKTV